MRNSAWGCALFNFMEGNLKMRKKYVFGIFLIGVLLALFSMTSFADGNLYCNGSDMFVNDNGEFFSNIDDEDKLYCKKTPQATEIKVLDKHIMSMVSDQNKNLYLLVYESTSTDLVSFNTETYEYNKLWSFDSVVTNISMREDKVYMKTNIGIQYYDIKTNIVGTLIENTNVDFIYFSDFNTLSYYSKNDNDAYNIHTYSFNNAKKVKKAVNNNSISLMSASSYSPRLSEPATNNAYYTSWNVFHTSGYGMVDGNGNKRGNCTCYAYGRSYENLGYKPSLCTGNAGTWYSYNANNGFYSYGKTPYLGAVAVWSKSGASGHVAVVEVINGDTVITSESGWNSFYFKTVTRSASNSNFSEYSSYNFLGFIYVCGENSGLEPPSNTWTSVSGNTVEVHWNGSANATSYDVYVLKPPYNWEDIVCKTNTVYGPCSFTIDQNGDYVAFVIAINGSNTSDYGNWSHFTISLPPPDAPTIEGTYPAYYSVGDSVYVQWSTVDNAKSYNYYLSRYPEGYAYESNDRHGTTTLNSILLENLEAGQYSLFVQAQNSNGTSAQSNWVRIVVEYNDYIPTKSVIWNDTLYALYDYRLEWTAVHDLFLIVGGHMVTITSEEENTIVHNLTKQGKNDYYWIGSRATDPYSDNYNFAWCTGENFAYTNWETGEPNHNGYHRTKDGFLQIYATTGKWFDAPNVYGNQVGFIIEYDLKNIQHAKELSYNGKTYLRYDVSLPWSEAQEFCKYQGGNLVVYDSDEEIESVKELLANPAKSWYYTGGFKENNQWQWVNGKQIKFTDKIKLWDVYYDTLGNYLMQYANAVDDAMYKMVGIRNVYHPTAHHSQNVGFICEKENETPVTKSNVINTDDTYSVYINFQGISTGRVITTGYNGNKLVSLQVNDYSENFDPIVLTGDIDTVKVMVWDDTSTMIPITKTEEIPATDFKSN